MTPKPKYEKEKKKFDCNPYACDQNWETHNTKYK